MQNVYPDIHFLEKKELFFILLSFLFSINRIIELYFTSGFTIDCTCILKEHFKEYSIWNIIKFNKKSFKILMVKQSKNKNTADIFSAIWRFSRSMQMYRIGVYNTTPRLISHNISNPSKFLSTIKVFTNW